GTKRPWNLRQFGMFPAYPKLIAIALSSGPLARTRIGEQMVAAHDELIRILHASSIPTVEGSSTPPREGTVMRFSAEIILILFVACSAALSVIASKGEGSEGQKPSGLNQIRAGNQSAEQMAKQDIDKEKQNAERQSKGALDQEAVVAIQETQHAIDAINANRTDEALKHIEQATGKINILLARNP